MSQHPFKDSEGLVGGQHDAFSRIVAVKEKKEIRFRLVGVKLELDIPNYKKIKVGKMNAIKLAKWILEIYQT